MFPTTNDLVPDDLTVYMLQLIFLSQVNFIFLLFLGMVMNANEDQTKKITLDKRLINTMFVFYFERVDT